MPKCRKGRKSMLDLQKASVLKRISASIFDIIILATLAVGLMWGTSSFLKYESYAERLRAREEFYAEKYGVDFDITAKEYEALTDEQKEIYELASKEYGEDKEAQYVYTMMFNLILIIVTFPILVSFLILEFIIPLCLKNGQTLGKKIFGIAVMQTNGTRIKHVTVFVRSILGKYTVGTMIPVYCILPFAFGAGDLLGLIVAAIILVVQVAMVFATRTNSPIHDGLSSTVVVDFATQMIFETEEELLEYKKKAAAKIAEERKY